MKFKIQVVHSKYPTRTPQLFAEVKLPDRIHVGYNEWIEANHEGIPEEIIKALNDCEVRDCIYSIIEKSNHQKVMSKYWNKRKAEEDRTSCAKIPAQNTMEICHTAPNT